MDILNNLGEGFSVALDPVNLLFVLIGVVVGTAIGVLPGLGPTATIALLLPITYTMDPTASIIMLAGIYYGSMYGGTITSVLLRLPGEAASVVTTFDGYQMTKQGRAGAALFKVFMHEENIVMGGIDYRVRQWFWPAHANGWWRHGLSIEYLERDSGQVRPG